jgi:hypothetical protein
MPFIRVRRPARLYTIIEASLLAGMLCGVGFALLLPTWWSEVLRDLTSPSAGLCALFGVIYLLPIVVAVLASLICTRTRSLIIIAVVFSSTYFIMSLCGSAIAVSDQVGGVDVGTWLYALLFGGLLALPAVMFTIVCAAVLRTAVIEHVVQTGTLCSKCGYDLRSLPADRACPECGSTYDPLPKKHRLFSVVSRTTVWGMRFAVVAYLLVVLLPSVRSSFMTASVMTGLNQDASSERIGALWIDSERGVSLDSWMARGIQLSIATRSDYSIGLFINHQVGARVPAQVRLLLNSAVAPGWHAPVLESDPRILCDLDQRQLDQVLSTGVPAALIEAMVERADRHGWIRKGATAPREGDLGMEHLDAREYFEDP